MGFPMAFVSQPYNIVQQRTTFSNMSHEAQQLPTPVTPQELNSTPDASAQTTLMRSPTALSTTLSGSRKRQCLGTFFKGKARAVYGLLPMLEQSLSSSEGSFLHEEGLEEAGGHCKRGCTEILKRLRTVFDAVGRHNSKTYATYMKSNPNPKKQATAHRNVTGTGNACVCTACTCTSDTYIGPSMPPS